MYLQKSLKRFDTRSLELTAATENVTNGFSSDNVAHTNLLFFRNGVSMFAISFKSTALLYRKSPKRCSPVADFTVSGGSALFSLADRR